MTSSLKFEDLELNNAARVFSHKVNLHRVDNGLDGVKSLVQKSSSSLVETNRRHGKILKDMTAQFENFENKLENKYVERHKIIPRVGALVGVGEWATRVPLNKKKQSRNIKGDGKGQAAGAKLPGK